MTNLALSSYWMRGRTERIDSLRRGLDELVLYASSRRVRLGLENRPS